MVIALINIFRQHQLLIFSGCILLFIVCAAILSAFRQVPRSFGNRVMENFRIGYLLTALILVVSVLLASEVKSAEKPVLNLPEKNRITITASTRGLPHIQRQYRVVLFCDTDAARAKGLQGHRPLKPSEAALFVFDKPETVTFWMGTVTFPIDIIFVAAGGSVVEVAPHCRPGSTRLYGSGVPVRWVIETAAGSGIAVGDRVRIE